MREDRALPAQRGAWRKLLAEGLVIVVSILLALGGDAWWANRSERAAELDLLTALHLELQANQSTVIAQRQQLSDARLRLRTLLQMTPAEAAAVSPDSLTAQVLMPLYRSFTAELTVGEINAAVSSGSLGLIRNRELRSSLAAYQARQGDAAELGVVMGPLNREARLAVARIPGLSVWAALEADVPVTPPPGALEAILQDPDLVALISAKASLFNGFLYETGRLLSQIDRVLVALEEELGV